MHRAFGRPEVVRVEEVPTPPVGDRDVLVRVRATSLTVADERMRSRRLPRGMAAFGPIAFGFFGPRRSPLGGEVAGTVAAVGDRATRFQPGDDVIATLGMKLGGHAEFVVVREDSSIVPKPGDLDFTDAVAILFGGMTADEFLGRVALQPGMDVLVNGASGAVGIAAVQLAAHAGANVTGVCSAANAALVREHGATKVIAYDEGDDFTSREGAWDVIVECVGNASFARVDRCLRPGGTLLLVVADLRGMLGDKRRARRAGKRAETGTFGADAERIERVLHLAREGALRPVIDSTWPLDDIVEAHRRVDTGRKRGSVVIHPQSSNSKET